MLWFSSASNETAVHRQKRHIYYEIPHAISTSIRASWGRNGIGQACLTSLGVLGSCQTFKACYPFFKLEEPFTRFPIFTGTDSWILGNYDTCAYYLDDGRRAYGVCCTNPVAQTDPSPAVPAIPDEQKFNIPSWPPQIPTHPPDHTPATHPPNFGNPFQQFTTQRPTLGTTTWATRPPSNLITTTTTRRPSLIITTPENIPDSNEVSTDGSCGAKNGNQVSRSCLL